MNLSFASSLSRPLGSPHSEILWRLLGVAVYELATLSAAYVNSPDDLGLAVELGLHIGFPLAFVLALGGSRPWALITASLLAAAYLGNYLSAGAERQVAEELIAFAALPIAGILVSAAAVITQGRRRAGPPGSAAIDDAVGDAHVCLFRISALVVFAFATIHKLNYDFFEPSVSCGVVLARELAGYWSVPFPQFVLSPSPLHSVLGEAAVPLLLLTYPRVGILWTLAFVGLIGHRGATAFTMLTFALTLSFLSARQFETFRDFFRRYPHWVLMALLAFAPLSAQTFMSTRLWWEFFVFQAVIVSLAAGVLYTFRDDLDRSSPGSTLRHALTPEAAARRILPGDRWGRLLCTSFLVLGLVNGLSPYLGLKYRLSFAMLSNLRVDDTRWNSMIFPRWLYLRSHDPFVHVTAMDADPVSAQRFYEIPRKEFRGLYVGLFSPKSFEYRLKYARFLKAKIDLELRYLGEKLRFDDALSNPEFEAFVDALPDDKMFQQGLAASGPQECVH